MNTIYFTQDLWQENAADDQLDHAVGEGRRSGAQRPEAVRPAREDNVIDLAAWKAENLVELEPLDERASGLGQYEGRELVRRRRRKYAAVQNRAELAATLAVVCAMAVLILRVLLF